VEIFFPMLPRWITIHFPNLMPPDSLLFVDTNIWLDFYRSQTGAGLSLLKRLEGVKDQIVMTYQVEIEFKKNRQSVISDSYHALKPPADIPSPGIFWDANTAKALTKDLKNAKKRVTSLKNRLQRALEHPTTSDPVYKICQRCFHKTDRITLSRVTKTKRQILRRAFRRFLYGCPPRKKNDTSIGDAINWEWIVEVAAACQSEIHIVSRDADYGITFEGRSYLNDHLWQEFKERVSKKRTIFLHSTLSEALKHFNVPVSQAEEKEETEVLQTKAPLAPDSPEWMSQLAKWFREPSAIDAAKPLIDQVLQYTEPNPHKL
jgi:hypothetical protein